MLHLTSLHLEKIKVFVNNVEGWISGRAEKIIAPRAAHNKLLTDPTHPEDLIA